MKFGQAAEAALLVAVVCLAVAQDQAVTELKLVQFHPVKKLEFVRLVLHAAIAETATAIRVVVVLCVH